MRSPAWIVALALLAASCASGARPDRSVGYLDELRPIARDVAFAIAGVGTAFDRAYESTLLRNTGLADIRIRNELAIARDRTERLTPTPTLAADHGEYLVLLDTLAELAQTLDASIAADDHAAAAVASTAMETNAAITFASLSPEMCDAVSFDKALCARSSGFPDYDAAVFGEMLRLAAAYVPLMRQAPGALRGDEVDDYLTVVDEEAATVLESTIAALTALTAPAERSRDHAILLAAVTQAAAAHRSGSNHARALEAFCTGASELGADAAPSTNVLFADDDLGCPVA